MKRKSNTKIVYSTDPDFNPDPESKEAPAVPVHRQKVRVGRERRSGGKTVTVIRGIQGSSREISELARTLKRQCSVGGGVKGDEIILQGDIREKVVTLLQDRGYPAKKSGG